MKRRRVTSLGGVVGLAHFPRLLFSVATALGGPQIALVSAGAPQGRPCSGAPKRYEGGGSMVVSNGSGEQKVIAMPACGTISEINEVLRAAGVGSMVRAVDMDAPEQRERAAAHRAERQRLAAERRAQGDDDPPDSY